MRKGDVIGITGATGFIGQAVVRRLLDAGFKNLRLFSRKGTNSILGYQTEVLRPDTDLSGVQTIIHLAADRGGAQLSREALFQANVAFTEELAKQAIAGGVARFVFVSSLNVHGKSFPEPIGPRTPPRPQTDYGESKAAAERILQTLSAGSAMDLVVIRPAMVYGPQGSGSFAALTKLAKTGLPLPFGRAVARRSVCSLENVASAIVSVTTAAAAPSILLVADPEDSSARDMLLAIRKSTPGASPLFPFPTELLAAAFRVVGKGDIAASLFEPLHIDRTHWEGCDWRPVEDGDSAMARAALAVV